MFLSLILLWSHCVRGIIFAYLFSVLLYDFIINTLCQTLLIIVT